MTQAQIAQLIRELVVATGYQCDDVEIRCDSLTQALIMNIRSPDREQLIGHDGVVMQSLQHVIQRIIEQQKPPEAPHIKFTLDVDNYYTHKLDQTKVKVRTLAEEVRTKKIPISLDPMNAYERLVVHTLLAPYDDILTESHGEDNNRYIIIRNKEVEN